MILNISSSNKSPPVKNKVCQLKLKISSSRVKSKPRSYKAEAEAAKLELHILVYIKPGCFCPGAAFA